MAEVWQGTLNKIDDFRYEIPRSYKQGMRVRGLIYADDKLIKNIRHDKAAEQVANVAFLPGIVGSSLAMPDIHWGYGFSIGGVAATDPENGGVVSLAGVGYDINCGVRLLRTNLEYDDIKDKIEDLTYALFNNIPSGVGSKGDIRLSYNDEKKILVNGAKWAVENGYGAAEDLEATEEFGAIKGADPLSVSERAIKRGKAQSGTLGSGNHFLEVQVIDKIFDEESAEVFNLRVGQITAMIHSGSRGLGYQVCDDFVKSMIKCISKYKINVPDRQLVGAPVNSPEAEAYISAMRCAANYAWANRQCLMHLTREVFQKMFGRSWRDMDMHLIYDVAHNIAKFEKHKVKGKEKVLCVHRKGATRAFPPGHPELPQKYQKTGQPVIIPGDMGRNSYLLTGTEKAAETFYSTCHGAGRLKSRTAATKEFDAQWLVNDLKSKGIFVKASGRGTISEEAPGAYKDVNDVVDVVHNAGISHKVCRMRPLGVIKG